MKVINMIPYGTRLGFHEDGVASTVARIDYKFPQCVCYENSEWGGTRHDGTGDQHDGDGKQGEHPDLDRRQGSTGYMP